MKYYKNLPELLTAIKYYNNIRTPPFQSTKYCNKKSKYGIYDCDYCLYKCKLNEYIKPVTYHTPLICLLTNKYKVPGDCNCVTKCSATQNDLELLFT